MPEFSIEVPRAFTAAIMVCNSPSLGRMLGLASRSCTAFPYSAMSKVMTDRLDQLLTSSIVMLAISLSA